MLELPSFEVLVENTTVNNHFLTIGHRGAAGEMFENSLSGFKHALALDIDAVELDIRAHKGELWVIHDHELSRLTGVAGYFDELEDPGNTLLNNGEPIPRLRDVLDLYWGKMPVNIEIKSLNTAKLLLQLLSQYPPLKPNPEIPWIIISSFDHRQILQLRQLGCNWALAPVSCGIPMQPLEMIETLQPYSWHIDDEYLDIELVRQIQDQGVRVMMYTVNELDLVVHLKGLGLDGIFTDYPSTLRLID
ncbi:MAG: glycerophosphodiester phosphodiesterase [Gammaproteobacteria bacterium]|nr:glycerophosphodiester phosphodiesterase [Gammaproteobacteria bacterium]